MGIFESTEYVIERDSASVQAVEQHVVLTNQVRGSAVNCPCSPVRCNSNPNQPLLNAACWSGREKSNTPLASETRTSSKYTGPDRFGLLTQCYKV